jgi:hypothetical protein
LIARLAQRGQFGVDIPQLRRIANPFGLDLQDGGRSNRSVPFVFALRPESVPNLMRRFANWLRSDVRVREHLSRIEEDLERIRSPKV